MIHPMRLLALITVFCFLNTKSHSQINFEHGYYINDSGQKIECLIKNIDWKNNPTEFEYRLTPKDEILKANLTTVKEFGISNFSKYVNAKVEIDRSSPVIKYMSLERNPIFREEVLFLKVLIEGQASLYEYRDGNLTRFFYKTSDSEITQLVHKKYKVKGSSADNNYYKQQLSQDLECQGINLSKLERLEYKRRDLTGFFTKYNECAGADYVTFEPDEKKDWINLTPRAGISTSEIGLKHSLVDNETKGLGRKQELKLGLEAEIFLPFNESKWSIIIEPTYQKNNSELLIETNKVIEGMLILRAKYESLELPVGLRHYFYLNDKASLFINASIVVDFTKRDSFAEIVRIDNSALYEDLLDSTMGFATGIGCRFLDKFSAELRYNANRGLFLNDTNNATYNSLSLMFGFTLL